MSQDDSPIALVPEDDRYEDCNWKRLGCGQESATGFPSTCQSKAVCSSWLCAEAGNSEALSDNYNLVMGRNSLSLLGGTKLNDGNKCKESLSVCHAAWQEGGAEATFSPWG